MPGELAHSPRVARIVDDLLLQGPRVGAALDARPCKQTPLGQCRVRGDVTERLGHEGRAVGQGLRDAGEVRPMLAVVERQACGRVAEVQLLCDRNKVRGICTSNPSTTSGATILVRSTVTSARW